MSDDQPPPPPGTDVEGAVRALILLAAKLVSIEGPCQAPRPWPTIDAPELRVQVTPAGIARDRFVVVRNGAFAWAEAKRRTIAPITDVARAARVIQLVARAALAPSTVHLPTLTPGSSSDAGHSPDPTCDRSRPRPADPLGGDHL